MIVNPYIAITRQDPYILQDMKEITSHQGKWSDFFQNTHLIYLEIGTGQGNFFSQEVAKNTKINFLGMEIKYKRLHNTSSKTQACGGKNFILLKAFGQNIVSIFSPNEIQRTYIFFPDPWHKKERQHKHKLLQKDFLKDLFTITAPKGEVFFKTDHREYFFEVKVILQELGLWMIAFESEDYEKETEKFTKEHITEFESIYRGEKKQIYYMELKK